MMQATGAFEKTFKKYNEVKSYNEMDEHVIAFDPSCLQLENVTDIYKIIDEINALSQKLYMYGILCDSQARVLQQLEDEFEKWKAVKYKEHGVDDKKYKNEKSKERFMSVQYSAEFDAYTSTLSAERYKLSLLQRVVKSLESYGYKLHDIKDYNMSIARNS